MKQIQSEEWNKMDYFLSRISNYEELYMNALDSQSILQCKKEVEFYALSEVYFDGNLSKFITFVKNNSHIERTARMYGSFKINGYVSMAISEDQDPEEIDFYCDQPDDLGDQEWEGFDGDGDVEIDEVIVMNPYHQYAKQFVKDVKEVA